MIEGERGLFSGGAPAARGCSIEGEREEFLAEIPLRGLLDWKGEEAVLGRAPPARGCLIEEQRGLFLGELPLRGAATLLRESRGRSFWEGSRCAGLHD